jgi:hypothetical protein
MIESGTASRKTRQKRLADEPLMTTIVRNAIGRYDMHFAERSRVPVKPGVARLPVPGQYFMLSDFQAAFSDEFDDGRCERTLPWRASCAKRLARFSELVMIGEQPAPWRELWQLCPTSNCPPCTPS